MLIYELVQLKVGKVTNLESLKKNKVVKQTVEVDGDRLEADLVISCIGNFVFGVHKICNPSRPSPKQRLSAAACGLGIY